MNQTITIPGKKIDEILSRLATLTKEVRAINTKLSKGEPHYGSDAWWEWSNNEALKEIKAGKYTKVSNKKELTAFLDSLK